MTSRITLVRRRALGKQRYECFYCGFPLWEPKLRPIEDYLPMVGMTRQQAKQFKATAEHRTPRCEGGSNSAENIVAACRRCNHTRHHRTYVQPLPMYQQFVRRRVAKRAWHHAWAHAAMERYRALYRETIQQLTPGSTS